MTALELRVHGVGGDPAHRVLGLPYPTDVEPVAAIEGRDAVYAPRQRDGRCAYMWGDLTSASPLFALWTLVLPFTLANVAGWMHPRIDGPSTGQRRARVGAIRVLVFAGGMVLTAAAVCWVATLTIGLFDYRAGVVFTSFLVAAALGGALTGVHRFEAVRLPDQTANPYHSLFRPLVLTDRDFFNGQRTLLLHGAAHVVVAATATVLVLVLPRSAAVPAAHTGAWAVGLTTIGLLIALIAFVLGVERRIGAADWRWGGSGAALALAHLLVAGVATAGLSLKDAAGQAELGRALALLDVFGVTLAAGTVVAVVTAIVVLLRSSPYESIALPPAERFLNDGAARRAARIAQLPRHVDLPVTALGLTGIVAAVWVVLIAGRGWDDDWVSRSNVWTRLALIVLLPLFGFVVRDVTRNAKSLDRRRRVGQVWDVMGFWPRSFHPLAVRPYGERAVPELIQILENAADVRAGAWTVTAHSQGAVLTTAAVVAAKATPDLYVITFGSPVRNLYGKAFPHYAGEHLIETFSAKVGQQAWTNIWRATDPVGREMHRGALHPHQDETDVNLPQPNATPPLPDPDATDLEQDTPLGIVEAHSGYRRSRVLRSIVEGRLRS